MNDEERRLTDRARFVQFVLRGPSPINRVTVEEAAKELLPEEVDDRNAPGMLGYPIGLRLAITRRA